MPRVRFLRRRGLDLNSSSTISGDDRPDCDAAEERPREEWTVDEERDELLTVARSDVFDVLEKDAAAGSAEGLAERASPPRNWRASKARVAKLLLKKGIRPNKKIVFEDDEDKEDLAQPRQTGRDCDGGMYSTAASGLNLTEALNDMKRADEDDRRTYRERQKVRRQVCVLI